ncbi:hypothetical protein E3N88_09400 [Mikania micrantha]|uniref:Uncharacterized protein n=1 Tax=Mikania micrantha TaxID=192012 RepID=A0A5N6PJ08_9ASTR|nr:hypothetical protein E3N88_09400 [Mikania micrantha]
MGDVAFRAVVNDLYQRLVSKVIKELALLWGLEDNISTLKNDFDQIKADLEDAEETPMIIKEKAQELCLKRLRSALLMIENLLQDFWTEPLLCRLYKERGIIDRVRTFFCYKHNQLMFRFRIAHRIKAIRKKLEELDYKRSSNTPRKTTHIDMGFESHMPDRETSSRMHDSSIIFGRNEEAEMPGMDDVIIPDEALHLSSSFTEFQFSTQDLGKPTSLRSILVFEKEYKWNNYQNFRHVYLRVLYLHGILLRTLPESIFKLKHLKYLNLSKSNIEVIPESIKYLQNLQVLVLSCCDNLYELPESICHLKLLTYLNLSESSIVVLPESITNLHSLQSLILSLCRNLYKLPEQLGCMRKLHHLHIYGCNSLRYLPLRINELTSLRILSWFPVCDDHICGAKIEELGNLNLIEGELEILGLQNVKGGLSEAKSANLSCKRNLVHLGLNWSHTKMFDNDKQVLEGDKQVLEGLEPNRLLKILKISGYEGNIISPSWMANLRNLVEIQLYWCKNCEHLPPTLVRLPNLKVIKMMLMDSLKCFHDEKEEIMFLSLQELDISMCESLVFLPTNIPKLKILTIRSCDNLVSLACSFPNLEVLKVTKCKELGSLPDNLLKLKNLYLNGCNKILSLPKDIQSFKDLKELVILGCKHLSEKCKKDKGEDWSKISHIPDIEIECAAAAFAASASASFTAACCYLTFTSVIGMPGNESQLDQPLLDPLTYDRRISKSLIPSDETENHHLVLTVPLTGNSFQADREEITKNHSASSELPDRSAQLGKPLKPDHSKQHSQRDRVRPRLMTKGGERTVDL